MIRIARYVLLLTLVAMLVGCPSGDGNGSAQGGGDAVNGGDATGGGLARGGDSDEVPLPSASGNAYLPDDPALIELNNQGVALMGRYDYNAAIEAFGAVVNVEPDWIDAQVNLAIATLNRQQDGDESLSLARLEGVLEREPQHPRALYCAALLLQRAGREDEAASYYREVADADPSDAYAAYFVGQTLERGDPEAALEWYRRSIDLDPYLRSPYYRASQVLQRAGESSKAQEYFLAFQRLDNNPRAYLAETIYTKMGTKAEALAVDLVGVERAEPVNGPVFREPEPILSNGSAYTWSDDAPLGPLGLTACDINDDEQLDLFIANVMREGDARNAMAMGAEDGQFTLDLEHPLARVTDVNTALWGDYDNDGFVDVYLCRAGPNMLWQRTESGWNDVTEEAKASGGDFDTVDGLVVDADHDGDLDLFCVNRDGPNELLNNNLDGTFRPLAAELGLSGAPPFRSRQVVAADLDLDRDLDLVILNEKPPHEVHLNDRLWSYDTSEAFGAFVESDPAALVVADANADGEVELWSLERDGGVARWAANVDGAWTRHGVLPAGSFAGPPGREQIAVLDVDGDGLLDLLATTGEGWSAIDLRSGATLGTAAVADIAGWTPIVLDASAGPAVVAASVGGQPLVARPGAGRYPFATFALSGATDTGQSMRSNASGIGAHLSVRIGSTWTMTDTLRATSGPGQSLQPVAIGLGDAPRVDFVTIDWSDGVLQTEMGLEPGDVHLISEVQRQASSCPVLFVWDGEKFDFVSDLLGVGGIGFLLEPGHYSSPRPWESILLPDTMVARKGELRCKIAEPMEESCYLDGVWMVAYDVPPGWSMSLDERMSINGPIATGDPVFYRSVTAPTAATNDRGVSVLDEVTTADGTAAPVGALDPRFIGRLAGENVVTLSFARALDEVEGEPILIADGWIEYPYSQTMFAAWQAQASWHPPTIEALGADGRWQIVLEEFGYPAGMPRQMTVPLASLPEGTHQLRIRTNQEIYWDSLAVAWIEPCDDAARHDLALAGAELRVGGFATRTLGPQRRPSYDDERRVGLWDTRIQSGHYTRVGAVDQLVRAADDALVIFGPGEEVELRFTALADGPPEGWTRHHVLETAGWCKDMDLFTRHGETLEPLPDSGKPSDIRSRLHAMYNTRFRSGR